MRSTNLETENMYILKRMAEFEVKKEWWKWNSKFDSLEKIENMVKKSTNKPSFEKGNKSWKKSLQPKLLFLHEKLNMKENCSKTLALQEKMKKGKETPKDEKNKSSRG